MLGSGPVVRPLVRQFRGLRAGCAAFGVAVPRPLAGSAAFGQASRVSHGVGEATALGQAAYDRPSNSAKPRGICNEATVPC